MTSAVLAAVLLCTPAGPDPDLRGLVTDTAGEPLAGAFVSLRDSSRGITVTVLTDRRGRYVLPAFPPGVYALAARRDGLGPVMHPAFQLGARDTTVDFTLAAAAAPGPPRSSAWLATLPDGPEKRRFILDCTGCHQLTEGVTEVQGRARTEAEWGAATAKMLGFAGSETGFPIISAARRADSTAAWLSRHLRRPPAAQASTEEAASRAVITEFDLPRGYDLPHDLALERDGRVVVTGMFSHVMYRLDPATGGFGEVPIPLAHANPRAVEVDSGGAWWVLLGMPQQAARFDPSTGAWRLYPLGMYPHSIASDGSGTVWFNGHFTKDPARLASLDPVTGAVRSHPVPAPGLVDGTGSPIPYEVRVGPEGTVWMSELTGNRVVAYVPSRDEFRVYTLPTPHSGPRRLDVDGRGIVWIPEYANNHLTRLDPRTGAFRQYRLPSPDALPYVGRADPRSGAIWIGTAGADALVRFEPGTERFVEYPLPTRGALIRHLAIDPRSGAVWAAYSPAPAVAPRVVRLEARP